MASKMGDLADSHELRDDWRAIISLLSLVSSLNSDSRRPIMHPNISKLENHKPLGSTDNPQQLVLHAIARLSERNHEILAVSTQLEPGISVTALTEGPTNDLGMGASRLLEARGKDYHEKLGSAATNGSFRVKNPDRKDAYFTTADTAYVKLVDPGTSHFEQVISGEYFKNQDFLLCPLEDYFATISAFVAERRVEIIPGHLESMIQYIVRNCWEKMSRRMRHWSSMGFINQLGNISPNAIMARFEQFKDTTLYKSMEKDVRYDRSLLQALVGLVHGNEIGAILEEYRLVASELVVCGVANLLVGEQVVGSVDNLLEALKHNIVKPAEYTTPYNRSTCVEFHHLYVATLIALRRALIKLGGEVERGASDKGLSFDRVFTYAWLLFKLTNSRLFEYHLEMLTYAPFQHFSLPIHQNEDYYRAWLRRSVPKTNAKSTPLDEETEGDGVGLEKDPEGVAVAAGLAGGDDDGVGFGEDPEDVAVAVGLAGGDDDGDEIDVWGPLRSWSCLMISHLLGLDALTIDAVKPTFKGPIPVHLIAVNRHIHGIQDPIKLNWQKTLEKYCSQNDMDAGAIKTLLQTQIDRFYDSKFTKGWGSNIMRHGVPSDLACKIGMVLYKGNVHCEAAIAALERYLDRMTKSMLGTDEQAKRLTEVIKNMHRGVIAVSKKCCPVCWELLEEVRGETSDFRVQGHHPIVYEVELPGWLPPPVLQRMVDRFWVHLKNALLENMSQEENRANAEKITSTPTTRGHKSSNSLSLESSSGMSVASRTSHGRQSLEGILQAFLQK